MSRDPKQFASRLREEMNRQNMSVRQLARRIDAANPGRGERNLYRWLGGEHLPSPASRAALAEALGVDREKLDPDDEEESPWTLLRRGIELLERQAPPPAAHHGDGARRLMPLCHRCNKIQATAELRRTLLGHICRDKTRCAARRAQAAPAPDPSPGRGGTPRGRK